MAGGLNSGDSGLSQKGTANASGLTDTSGISTGPGLSQQTGSIATAFLVDASGNFVVDASGNKIIKGPP